MAKSGSHLRLLKASVALDIWWYVQFLTFVFYPQILTQLLGSMSWSLYLFSLTFTSVGALLAFFFSTVELAPHHHWKKTIAVNALLNLAPLYFLWWTYIQ